MYSSKRARSADGNGAGIRHPPGYLESRQQQFGNPKRFKIHDRRFNEGTGIAIPVRIRGPWADPSILPDLEAAIDLNFAEEAERLKTQAEDAVRNRVAEELGVSGDAAQDLEGAAKTKIEDEIKKGLRSLFD